MVYELISPKTKTFPWKLHEMLEMASEEGFDEIVSWLPDGKSFKVHKPAAFVEIVMAKFFQQSKYKSFQRQLNLWGFERLTSGWNKGGYTRSEYFLRSKSLEIGHIQRRKMKCKRVSSKKKAATITIVKDDDKNSNDCSEVPSISSDSDCDQSSINEPVALTTPMSEKEFPTGLISDILPDDDRYPQTGDCLDFEGRNYFFVDEEEIKANARNTGSNIGLLQRMPTPQISFGPSVNTFGSIILQQVF